MVGGNNSNSEITRGNVMNITFVKSKLSRKHYVFFYFTHVNGTKYSRMDHVKIVENSL